MNKVIRNNIVANYFGKVWSFVSIYLFVPFYIHILGIEAYGVINFYTVLLGLMMFADAGLSSTMSREFAKSEQVTYLRNLLFSTERIYLVLAVLISLVIGVSSGFISQTWMSSSVYSTEQLALYVSIMGVAIAFQFFATLYASGLMGLQQQVLVNVIQVVWSIVRSGGGVLVLYLTRDLTWFLFWQVASNVGYMLYTRYQLWLAIRANEPKIFDWKLIHNIRSFALGMMLMALIASLNTQLDKLLVSKYLSLQQFGYYSIASTLSQLPLMLITPIIATVLPVLTKYVALADIHQLKNKVGQYSYIIMAMSSLIGLIVVVYPERMIELWTHNTEIAQNSASIARILALGGILLTMQYVPYMVALSNGHTRSNIVFGVSSVVIITVLLNVFIQSWGLIGAAYPWLIVNGFVFIGMSIVLLRKFLPGFYGVWFFQSVLLPFVGSLLPMLVLVFLPTNPYGDLGFIISLVLMGITTLIIHYYLFKKVFRVTVFNVFS